MRATAFPSSCCLCDGSLLIPYIGRNFKFPIFPIDEAYIDARELEQHYIVSVLKQNNEPCHFAHLHCMRYYVQFFHNIFGILRITCPAAGCPSQFLGPSMLPWITVNSYRMQFNSQLRSSRF